MSGKIIRKCHNRGTVNTEELFQKYRNKVYWLAVSITHNKNEAQDVLQNSFLKIIENIKGFRGESQLSTWIYRIAYNEALSLFKRKYKTVSFSDYVGKEAKEIPRDLFVNWSELPDEHLLDDELKERIEEAIRRMPLKYRIVLILHHVERLPLKEISTIVRMKVNSLKTRLHRACGLLREEIAAYEHDILKRRPEDDAHCGLHMKFVYDYLKQALDEQRRASFDTHIVDCPPCKSFLATYKKAMQITSCLQCQDIPSSLRAKIETFLFKRKG